MRIGSKCDEKLSQSDGSAHGKALCRAARTVPMVIGAIGAWCALSYTMTNVQARLRHGDGIEIHALMAGWVFLVPLVLASVAWRWHLIGGLSIVVAAGVFLSYFILRPPYEARTFYVVYFPMAMVFLGGGILHLAAWLEERRG